MQLCTILFEYTQQMLASLSIRNYALIDNLRVEFNEGFSIITGETGAGKSILLGGLALVLGKRADLSSIKNKEKKCIIEGEFAIRKFDLKSFFDQHDLDFEEHTIIRREILPNSKSRAFINDTPVTLSVLSLFSDRLIDIHSQHQTLELSEANFQLLILDAIADNKTHLSAYKEKLNTFKKKKIELEELIEKQRLASEQHDYHSFLLTELLDANFQLDEQLFLEETIATLNHAEEIKTHLATASQLGQADEVGIGQLLQEYMTILTKLSKFSSAYKRLEARLQSLKIEFDDISYELATSSEITETNPKELEQYNSRLQLLYDLQKKHQVLSVNELLEKQQWLNEQVDSVESTSEHIDAKQKTLLQIEQNLNDSAAILHKNREAVIPNLTRLLEDLLKDLEMPHTAFKINLIAKEFFLESGKDEVNFLTSTNKGSTYEPLKKIASGGELSRIMLAVKSILCNYSNLPTIIFDEIDTGVSGEVSNRIALVMAKMSKKMQVIAITHLPQIAAKGSTHYKVFKTDINNETITNIKLLSSTERVEELAEMLSGKEIADSAIVHAKQLLKL